MADFGYIDQQNAFDQVIRGNAFRVDFLSDYSFAHGRFRIQWACDEEADEDTTVNPTTMARMGETTVWSTETTSTTMTTTTTMTVTTTMGGTQVKMIYS